MTGFLDTITEDDLAALQAKALNPYEDPIFDTGEHVELVVTSLSEVKSKRSTKPSLMVKTKVLNTKFEGANKTLFVPGERQSLPTWVKSNYASLLATLLGEEAIKTKKANMTDAVGVKFTAVAGKPRTYNGSIQQELSHFTHSGKLSTDAVASLVSKQTVTNSNLDEIPF